MIRVPTDRFPTHPGKMLREEFLEPLGISEQDLADQIYVSRQEITELVNGQQKLSPSTALRLSKFLGTSPEFWLNLQLRCDLYQVQYFEADILSKIERCPQSVSG